MGRGKVVVDGGVSVEGTSGLLPHEKLKVELELSDSEGSLEPTTPLSLSERDEEDEDVESEVEPEEDLEEEPEEDPEEEPEEDPEEEPEGNHVEYHVEQSYEMFHIPYVEYTPTSPGTYWERLYKDEMPQAQLEIHSLKRKIKEIDEHRSRLVQENQIRVDVAEKSKRKIRRLEQEVLELRKPTITKLWEGFVAWAKQAKAATYGFLDKVVGREPPQAELICLHEDLGGSLGSLRRKSASQLELMLEHQDISRNPTEPKRYSGSHRGQGRGHGRGRAANTITREELANEIARAIRDTLPDVVAQAREAIMGEYEGNLGGGEEDYEYSTPNMSRKPSIAQPTRHHGNHDRRGCSYKTFMNCKPPIFNGEIDPILSSTWIMEIKGTFDTSKCADEDKVIYAATMLKGEAIHWWGMVKEVRA
ncbi:unnamed protein product [Lactuca saligna]|uniref:Retrotransposon gag domain-containing protein n=1 Tax=Lactuca saligna TaxID=75948 RepID=A0AA35VL08_LACSI|nr:unnamed protein product [Lactuca saligna]